MVSMIKQAKMVLNAMNNPEAALAQFVNSNPIVKQTISQYGSVDGAIIALCKQKGIDPHEFMEAVGGGK